MKVTQLAFVVSLVVLAGCSTTPTGGGAKGDSETVLVTYHVQSGKEAELQATLMQAWEVYRTGHMVFAQPHVIVRSVEEGGKTRFVEVFTWVSGTIPEHAPDAVKEIWAQEQSLCESRGGHPGIEGGEVELVAGK